MATEKAENTLVYNIQRIGDGILITFSTGHTFLFATLTSASVFALNILRVIDGPDGLQLDIDRLLSGAADPEPES
jgi:hypothetical protein